MTRFIAFLRAINPGPGRNVKMESLSGLFEALGFSRVSTSIASGNVVFETETANNRMLNTKIEKGLRETLGCEVATFLRTEAELAEISSYEPIESSSHMQSLQQS